MAKKNRKPNLPEETLARARRELYGHTGPVVEEEKVTPAARPTPATSAPAVRRPVVRAPIMREADLRKEYAYVVRDLQNIAILAAGLMVVLVIMSFFI